MRAQRCHLHRTLCSRQSNLTIDVSEIIGTFVAFVVSSCGQQKVGLRAFSSDASVVLISDTSIGVETSSDSSRHANPEYFGIK